MFNFHFSIERWKWNADFGIYVSNKGRFRSRDKKDLPIKINQKGYCLVYCEGTINKYRFAHRVVMLTWRPNDDAENLTVDHLNHNKRDNSLSNLEWVTFEENIRRAKEDLISVEECEPENDEVHKGKFRVSPNTGKNKGNPIYYFDFSTLNIEELKQHCKFPPNFDFEQLKRKLKGCFNKKDNPFGKTKAAGYTFTLIK
jgi:hypothetical protein